MASAASKGKLTQLQFSFRARILLHRGLHSAAPDVVDVLDVAVGV